jgi:putative ABC transport system permease protein
MTADTPPVAPEERIRRLPLRLIAASGRQAALFVLATALSLLTVTALGSFRRSVWSALMKDARELHAGDVILVAHQDFSPGLLAAVDAVVARGDARSVRVRDFYSVVSGTGGRSLLASIRAVTPGHPLYGSIQLASGREFGRVLEPGGVIVAESLPERLSTRVGGTVTIGGLAMPIVDVVLREPDRPVSFFSLGPRILVHADDLPALGLLREGSRVDHRLLLRAARPDAVDRIAAELRAKASSWERVETYRTARSGIKKFLDNFIFFLSLTAIFSLLLAGFGMQSCLAAMLRDQRHTIAVMKALGATSSYIRRRYFAMVAMLGAAGIAAGILGGFLLQQVLPLLFSGLVPLRGARLPSGGAVAEGVLFGCAVLAVFTYLPLKRLQEIKPAAVFGREEFRGAPRWSWLPVGAILGLFTLLVIRHVGDVVTGLIFTGGTLAVIVAATAGSWGLLRLIRRFHPDRPVWKLAVRSLLRPGSATMVVLVTLTAALSLIMTIHLVEENIFLTFIRSYPPESPNVYFLDVQPAQKDAFAAALAVPLDYYPIIRARVTAINGEPMDAEKEAESRFDNFSREFNLTDRDRLLDDEFITKGGSLFRESWGDNQVSVLDEVLEMHRMAVGDVISFDVQGVPLEARVSSIRSRTESSVRPFFYFVLPTSALRDAPRTFFATARIDRGRIPGLQGTLAAEFPGVVVIDISETVAVFSALMGKLSVIVRFFTWFSIAAGLLILVSSIMATRRERIRETVYYRILGARRAFVARVIILENLLVALVSVALAAAVSEVAALMIVRRAFKIAFHPFPGTVLLLGGITVLMVLATGWLSSRGILRKKPVNFLRESAQE